MRAGLRAGEGTRGSGSSSGAGERNHHGGGEDRCPRGKDMQEEQAPGRGLRFQQWPPEGAAQTHPAR